MARLYLYNNSSFVLIDVSTAITSPFWMRTRQMADLRRVGQITVKFS